jgi:hypothetical protein
MQLSSVYYQQKRKKAMAKGVNLLSTRHCNDDVEEASHDDVY